MKKIVVSALASLLMLSFGSVFAQVTSVDHDVRVTIPEVVMIRMSTTDGNPAIVQFDYNAAGNRPAYFAALEAGGGVLPPTGGNLAAVEVLAIGTTWQVNVTAGAFTLGGIALSDIAVTPDAAFGVPFTLAAGTAAMSGGATNWVSLGISNASFALTVDGDEDAGDETIVVTYTIVDL